MPDFRKPFRAPPLRRKPDNVAQFHDYAGWRGRLRRMKKSPKKKSGGWRGVALMGLCGIALGTVAGVWMIKHPPGPKPAAISGPAASSSDQESAHFSRCFGPVRNRVNCVVDGDTFWYEGDKIRIADINTPEVSEPECPSEAKLGEEATQRLQDLLNAGPFTLESADRDTDRYGRLLRVVTRGGESLGEMLVSEGLAEEWQGYRGSWC